MKAGKARYIGASSMYAWQFCKALYLADRHGWTRFVSMQNHYNLLYREEEREMMGSVQAEGIGVIPWSPLARGRLARPWENEPTHRSRRHRRVRQDALRADRTTPTEGRRPRGRAGRSARRSAGAGGAGLDAAETGASPRRSSARPSRIIWTTPWRRCRSSSRRGDRAAGGAVRAAPGVGFRMNTVHTQRWRVLRRTTPWVHLYPGIAGARRLIPVCLEGLSVKHLSQADGILMPRRVETNNRLNRLCNSSCGIMGVPASGTPVPYRNIGQTYKV